MGSAGDYVGGEVLKRPQREERSVFSGSTTAESQSRTKRRVIRYRIEVNNSN